MTKNKILHLGGAKGVGKTTLLRGLCGSVLAAENGIVIVHMSNYLRDLSLLVYEKNWGLLSENERQVIRVRAAQSIQTISARTVLLDSHCIDMKDGLPVKIMPREFEEIVDGYIVMVAAPEVVRERRMRDGS